MFNVKEFLASALKSEDAWTGVDKKLHFLGGFAITLLLSYLFNPIVAMSVLVALAIGKEIYDHVTPGHNASYKDFLVGIFGGVVGVALFMVVI
jgi:uncharacterized protein YfiM (DUF2279 family)